MRALRVAGAALGALFCAACTVPDATPDGTPSTPSLVVTSVDIVDVESGEILQDRTISIGGERILEVTGEPPPGLPDGVRVIDGRGLYAIPGLWDMHMHNVADTADLVPWDFHRPDPGDPDAREIYLPIYLAFGVTGTREMSGGEGSLALRDRIERGEILGPHMVVGSPILDGDPPLLAGGSQILIPGPARARAVVDSLYEAGFDFLKPYTLLTAETYRALVARADELEIEVAGELPLAISAWEAAHLGQRSIEHLTGIELASSGREAELREGYLAGLRALDPDSGGTGALEIWNRGEWEPLETLDPEKQGRLFAHLAARDTWVVPTLVVQRMTPTATIPRSPVIRTSATSTPGPGI